MYLLKEYHLERVKACDKVNISLQTVSIFQKAMDKFIPDHNLKKNYPWEKTQSEHNENLAIIS